MFLDEFPTREEYLRQAAGSGVVPVCEVILADSETPVSLLGRFFANDRSRRVFLLESVEGGERWGRYSFLGTAAHAVVRVYEKRVEVERDSGIETITHTGDPLPVLRGLMERYRPAPQPKLPRFWGGLVGYFTYESVSFFEKRVPNKLGPDAPLAVFMIPSELLIFDNVSNSLTVTVLTYPQDGDHAALYSGARRRIGELIEVIKSASEPQEEGDDGDLELRPVIGEEQYRDRVRRTQEMIVDGEIIQAVIAQRFTCKAPRDLVALYRAQRHINPSPYMYFINIGDGGTIIGSSPETLVRLEGRTATVRPIAGTRKRGLSEQEDRALADELLKDEKERAEHLMLVDLGRNDLGRVACTGTVQVTDLMFVERYSHVMHLVSNVTCEVEKGYDAFDLFAATFPAGTLSGAPKVRAMEIIAQMEDFPRGFYGGAVGYVAFGGNMDFAITIRTACAKGEELTVIAGGGIVYDSQPEFERQETLNKARSVQRSLELLKQSLRHRVRD